VQPLSVSLDGTTLGVALRGEIDFSCSAPVTDAIRTAVADSRPALVRVDLAEVAFLDSSGLGVLVAAMRAAQEVGAGFRVERPNRNVYDQLDATGLAEVFGLTDVEGGRAVRGLGQ
jgi:anti-sigma B factor antagonist